MSKQTEALKLALEALKTERWPVNPHLTMVKTDAAITAIREALAEQPAQWCEFCSHHLYAGTKCKNCGREQPAQQQEQKLEFVSPGGGYVPAIPKPIPLDWKLVPRKATPEMLKAMDECAQEGYDERLYAGMASSVYMAAWDASPVMGTLPEQPAQQQEPVAIDRLYIEALIEGLYQNEDPVSIDAAEEFERLLKTPASPPASKPWVGLTDEEMKAIHCNAGVTYLVPADYDRHLFTHMTDVQLMKISKAIEAKLREKNT